MSEPITSMTMTEETSHDREEHHHHQHRDRRPEHRRKEQPMTMIQNTPETSFLNGISGGLLHTPAHHPLSRDVRDGNYPETPKSIRDLVAAEDALAALADRERTTPREDYSRAMDRIGDALIAGEPLPDDLDAQVTESLAAAERQRVLNLAISSLRGQVQARWVVELREHADEMLTGLAGQLDALLGEVRTAAGVVDGARPHRP